MATDEEVNHAVARKLGWKFADSLPSGSLWYAPNASQRTSIPDYCHDIKAAWDVVEKLFQEGICIQVNVAGNEKMVGCNIGEKYQQKAFGSADTAPMAICLAFLKLLVAP